MEVAIVKNIESKESTCKTEAFKDDFATDPVYSVVDTVPIAGQKLIKLQLAGGDTVIIAGEIIETSGLTPGEKRIKSTDANGNVKTKITLHDDGTLEIEGGTKEMVNILSDALKNIIDYAGLVNGLINGISTATIPTALGGAILSILYPTYFPEYAQAEAKKTAIEAEKTKLDEYKV